MSPRLRLDRSAEGAMLYAGLVVVIVVAGIAAYRARSSSVRESEVVRGAVAWIRREEVPVLAAECARTARDRFAVDLDGGDIDVHLQRIDALLREEGPAGAASFRDAFGGPGHPDRYVAVVGSLVGELLRSAGEAEWESGPDAPVLRLTGEQRRTVSPFAEVIRTARQPKAAPLASRLRGRTPRARAGTLS
jgi:hypothetical protein